MEESSKSFVSPSGDQHQRRFPVLKIMVVFCALALVVGIPLICNRQPVSIADASHSTTFSAPDIPQDLKIEVKAATAILRVMYPSVKSDPQNAYPFYADRAITFGPFEKIPEGTVFSVKTPEHSGEIAIDTEGLELAAGYSADLDRGHRWLNSHLMRNVEDGGTLLQLSAQRFDDGIYLVLETFRRAEDVGLEPVPAGVVPTKEQGDAEYMYLEKLGEYHRRDYTHVRELVGSWISLNYEGDDLVITQANNRSADILQRDTILFGSRASD